MNIDCATPLPEERIAQACGALRDTIRDVSGHQEWKYEMLGKVGSIEALAEEFIYDTAQEQKRLARGEKLHKDHPRVRLVVDTLVPRRKKGFIDVQHTIEYRLTKEVKSLLQNTQEKNLPDAHREKIIASLRTCLEVIDDCGIVLNQFKEFAARTTMPRDKHEHGYEAGKVRYSPGIFTNLNVLQNDQEKPIGVKPKGRGWS